MKVEPPFPRITYTEAVDLLNKNGFDITWGDDLGAPKKRSCPTNMKNPFS